MHLKWRARLTWVVGMAAFVALMLIIKPERFPSPWYVILAILPLVTLIAAQFLAFRCPHCGARAVRGYYWYWVVSDACSQCLRDFEGPFLSEDEVAEKLLAEDKPDLAKRMRQERLEEEDLRNRAALDPQAAATLERILNERLVGVEGWVRDVHRIAQSGQGDRKDVATAEAALKKVQDELAWCRSLPRGSAE